VEYQELVLKGTDTIAFAKQLLRSPPGWEGKLRLNLKEVGFITPFIAVLVGVGKRCGWEIIKPETEEPRDYIEWMVHAGEIRTKKSNYIPVEWGGERKDVEEFSNRFKKLFEKLNEELCFEALYGLTELMDNVIDHAKSKKGFCVHAQLYRTMKAVEFAVADLGIGISESLRENPNYQAMSPHERFKKALELKVTRDSSKHSGEGLSCLVGFVEENREIGMQGVIISHEHYWLCSKTENLCGNLPAKGWPGTLTWFRLLIQRKVSLKDFWEYKGLIEGDEEIIFNEEPPF